MGWGNRFLHIFGLANINRGLPLLGRRQMHYCIKLISINPLLVLRFIWWVWSKQLMPMPYLVWTSRFTYQHIFSTSWKRIFYRYIFHYSKHLDSLLDIVKGGLLLPLTFRKRGIGFVNYNTPSMYMSDKVFASFWHLTCKNLHKNEMHVNWHTQFRFWHVVWLVKRKTTRQLTF